MSLDQPHVNSGVYVLRCEDGKFYVGKSRDIYQRLSSHNAAWTEEYHPVEVEEVFPAEVGLKELEREVTLMYMREHGWENVRGAGWTKVEMKRPPKALRQEAVA